MIIKDKDKVSEAFMSKLTINRRIVGEVFEKTAILEVADKYGNRFNYNITDAKSIQEMLEKYDADERNV